MNDAELVKKILAGDEERFGEIVDRYARKVWALCASYVHNPSDCEDLVQESFVRSYLRLNTIREPNAFGAWLGQIARTRCLEWLRKRTREKEAVANLEESVPTSATEAPPSESAERKEMHAFVRRNLDALPVNYREALYLFYIGGHSVAEAAQFLDITESAMKKRLQLGREKLRDRMTGAIEEALGDEKPRADLEKTVLAAVPFGQAVWLGKGGLLAGASAAAGFSGALAGLGWAAAAVVLATLAVGGYAYYTSHGQPAQAGAARLSDMSDQSDVSDLSDPDQSPSPSGVVLARAEHAQPEKAPDTPKADPSSEGLVHWKWVRNAEPSEKGNVAKALRDPVSIEFEGEHVMHILEFISEYKGVSIVVDSRAVPPAADIGAQDYRALVWERYPKAAPSYVTDGLLGVTNLENVTLSTALEHLLYPLGLVYQVKPYGIFVTTPSVQRSRASREAKDEADDVAAVQQVLNEVLSLEYRNLHLTPALVMLSESRDYDVELNIVIDQRAVPPPGLSPAPVPTSISMDKVRIGALDLSPGRPAAHTSSLQLLSIAESSDGNRRALIQTKVAKWYEEEDRFEDYQLLAIDPRGGEVEVFAESLGRTIVLGLDEKQPIPDSVPAVEAPHAGPRAVQKWLKMLDGKQIVTDGLVDRINLRDVELRYALDALLTPLNLTCENEGDYIFVSSPELLVQDNERTAPESEITPELREALAGDVSIEFEGEELVRVLGFLSESCDADIAMGSQYVEIRRPENEPPELVLLPEANWNVPHCNLRDVPLQAALDALLRQHGLDFLPAGDRILVGPPDELSELEQLPGDHWISLNPKTRD